MLEQMFQFSWEFSQTLSNPQEANTYRYPKERLNQSNAPKKCGSITIFLRKSLEEIRARAQEAILFRRRRYVEPQGTHQPTVNRNAFYKDM
jgi:hypothetical protein